MKAKYIILDYLTEEGVAFLFPLHKVHAEEAQRLEAKESKFLAPLKVVSAGEVFFEKGYSAVTHGSVSLNIHRNISREQLDLKILASQFRN